MLPSQSGLTSPADDMTRDDKSDATSEVETGSIDPTQTCRLTDWEAVCRDLLDHHRLVTRESLLRTVQAGSDDSARSLLEALVEAGQLTAEEKSAVESFASLLLKRDGSRRSTAEGESLNSSPTVSMGDRTTRPAVVRVEKDHERGIRDYEIIEEIAQGGMGVVYLARQTKLNRTVALKMIRAGELADAKQVARFHTEAEAAAKLDHPGIVPVYEVGESEGRHFYSMAFIEGCSLNDRVKNDGPLDPRTAATLVRDAARAVHYAHSAGVIHRDIKPHNILVDRSGNPRVTDFGLAKLQHAQADMTATGQVLGTPAYMPPEQATGRISNIGAAADIYSLGATLYFLLIGRPPFQAASTAETIRHVVETEPVAPRKLNPSIPRDLETICLKCLRKEVSSRYSSADALAEDLERWLNDQPIVARRIGRAERAWKWCRRNPVVTTLALSIVVLALISSLTYWYRQNAARADGLVDSLVKAEPRQVAGIVAELQEVRSWSTPRLRRIIENDQDTLAADRARLHAQIALASDDSTVVPDLFEALLSADLHDVGNIRGALARSGEPVGESLWQMAHSSTEDSSRRFRALLALAGLSPGSARWSEADFQFVVEQMVAANPVYQPELWRLLSEVNGPLLEPLEIVFLDETRSESQLVAAANAIRQFAPDDALRLGRLLPQSTAEQYNILFDRYERVSTNESESVLRALVTQQATADMGYEARIQLGRRRAGAAITLFRQGQTESMLDVFRYQDDPEALTQCVVRCRERGVTPHELLRCFELVDERRGSFDDGRQKDDDSVMYAVLLALGEFSLDEMPAPTEPFITRLVEIYEKDPSSCVHGTAGWLLRRWGFHDEVARVDQSEIAYDETGYREWFVIGIEYGSARLIAAMGRQPKIYLTFIVFPPGEFTMGSPDDEPFRMSVEGQHRVVFSRPLAVCDREVTWQQWEAFRGAGKIVGYQRQFSRTFAPDEPAFGVSWFESVSFCRWLTERQGFPEARQSYTDPSLLPENSRGDPSNWPVHLDRDGCRLPTEAEWEYVSRGGTRTAYSFGNDPSLLGRFAWYRDNSERWSHEVAALRPNPRGLFDVHGNVSEWCHDWFDDELTNASDPTGPPTGTLRVFRQGSFGNGPESCRSAFRLRGVPTSVNFNLGFRVVMPLP